jgi:hypothetical protein
VDPGSLVDFFCHFSENGYSATVTGNILWCADGCVQVLAWFPRQCMPLVIDCDPDMTAPEYITAMIAACFNAMITAPGD